MMTMHLHRQINETGGRSGMGSLRATGRAIKLLGYFVEAAGELIVDRPQTRQQRAEWLHQFCARAMKGMGITVSVRGKFPPHGAVISNHLSYLDIVTLASLHRCVFVSKAEIAKIPVLGWMTTNAGTVYVERGRGGSALKASSAMQQAMEDGLPVVFFPEGTTTNGEAMKKFHSGLLGQALLAKAAITPVFLRYSLTEKNGPGVTVAEDVCWGDKPMFEHVWGFLGLRGVHAEVRFGAGPIEFSGAARFRKAAAVEAEAAVAALGGGVPVLEEELAIQGADLVRE
jgi:1-acyl-sn-glycerol-3-phosphate acyltransferase